MFENFSDSKIDLYIFWIFPHCPSIFYTRSNDEDIAVLHEKQWWRYCHLHEKQWWRYCRFTWEAMMKMLPFYMRSNDEDVYVLHEKQWWRYCSLTWKAMMKTLPFYMRSNDEDIAVLHEKLWWRYCSFSIHFLHCLCGINMHK